MMVGESAPSRPSLDLPESTDAAECVLPLRLCIAGGLGGSRSNCTASSLLSRRPWRRKASRTFEVQLLAYDVATCRLKRSLDPLMLVSSLLSRANDRGSEADEPGRLCSRPIFVGNPRNFAYPDDSRWMSMAGRAFGLCSAGDGASRLPLPGTAFSAWLVVFLLLFFWLLVDGSRLMTVKWKGEKPRDDAAFGEDSVVRKEAGGAGRAGPAACGGSS